MVPASANWRSCLKTRKSVDSRKKLSEMSQPESAMVRQFPYHFYDNLDLTDYPALLYDLKDFKGGLEVPV